MAKKNKQVNRNSVLLMYAVLGAMIFMIGILVVWKFFM